MDDLKHFKVLESIEQLNGEAANQVVIEALSKYKAKQGKQVGDASLPQMRLSLTH